MSIPASQYLIHDFCLIKKKIFHAMVNQSCKHSLIFMEVHRVSFEGEINRSVPDIDGDDANAEWKFFVKYYSKSTTILAWKKSLVIS